MRAALSLLRDSDLAAAICGDKSSLPDRDAYYRGFYDFADSQPDLALVRIFGPWSGDKAADETRLDEHNERRKPNVLGLWASKTPDTGLGPLMDEKHRPGFGMVLVKSAHFVTALLHWGKEEAEFEWLATSDPLVTTVLMDSWSLLSETCKRSVRNGTLNGREKSALTAFRRRFGMVLPN